MSVSVWSHPLYRWYNTHPIYDITSTVYMAPYALYMTSHPRFMTSQQSTHDIKGIISHLTPIISDSTSPVSLSSHPHYRSYNPHCMYDNTATICLTSYELHMTSYPIFMLSHRAMTSHPLHSCHHTQDTYHCIHCSQTITYNVLITSHLLDVWHETHYMVGDFNTPLTTVVRSTKQKINKETQTLKDTMDQLDLIHVYRTFHPKTINFTFFSSAHGTFSKIDHILGHKSSLGKFKKIEIIPVIFSDHSAVRLDINYRKKIIKNSHIWKLNNMILNNQQIIE